MALPWINTSLNPLQRASQVVARGNPLTTSYPNSTFYVTAQNGAPLAPGQSPAMKRINPSGLQTTGDVRATGSFYDITSAPSLQALITGGAPTTYKGGNATTYNLGSPATTNGSVSILWIVVVGLVVALFVLE